MDHVNRILDNTTNLNAVNGHGRTPLHIAAIRDNHECIQRLLDHRKKGIMRFVRSKHLPESEMIQLNLKDKYGDTPLLLAVKNDSSEAANIILTKLKSTSNDPTSDEWKLIWSHCLSAKMRRILRKYYQDTLEMDSENRDDISSNISKDKIVLKLPRTFRNLLSLLIDKILAIFPSPIIFFAKLSKPNILFNNLKIKEQDIVQDMHSSTKLDSGIELNFTDLIKDVRFQKEIYCSANNRDFETLPKTMAHEYVKEMVRRKLPVC